MKDYRLKKDRGFTLIEMVVTMAIIGIIVGTIVLSSMHQNNQSIIGGVTALDATMENAQGIARGHNGATIEITPDPINTSGFKAIIFAGTPGPVGSVLTQEQVVDIPVNLTTAAGSLYPGKWMTGRTGIIDIFVSEYGDTDFAQDWDPSVKSVQEYPGCVQNTGLILSMSEKGSNGGTQDAGGVTLDCNRTSFVQYTSGTVPNVTATPSASPLQTTPNETDSTPHV